VLGPRQPFVRGGPEIERKRGEERERWDQCTLVAAQEKQKRRKTGGFLPRKKPGKRKKALDEKPTISAMAAGANYNRGITQEKRVSHCRKWKKSETEKKRTTFFPEMKLADANLWNGIRGHYGDDEKNGKKGRESPEGRSRPVKGNQTCFFFFGFVKEKKRRRARSH